MKKEETILIRQGLVIDGTGEKGEISDIRIEGDSIVEVKPDIPVNGSKIVEAKGKIVRPGTIDIHHHADLNLKNMPLCEPSIHQGMTTLVTNQCGLGIFPSDKSSGAYDEYVQKGFGGAETVYEDLDQFREDMEKTGISSNIIPYIAQGNIRACEIGLEERVATTEEMENMKTRVRTLMGQGAWGLSSGLVYPTGSNTPTDELIEMARVVAEYDGVYTSHVRNEGGEIMKKGWGEFKEICQKSEIRGHYSHISVISGQAKKTTQKLIKEFKKARNEENLQITADASGCGDTGTTSLAMILLRDWVFDDFKRNLSDPKTRKKIINEIYEKLYQMFFADAPWYLRSLRASPALLKKLIFTALSKKVFVREASNHPETRGKMLNVVFAELYPGKNIANALLDFLLEEDGNVLIGIFHKDVWGSVIPLISQDFVCFSTDGIFNPGNTSPGTYQKNVEQFIDLVRDGLTNPKGEQVKTFSPEEAIYKMTGFPAEILKLKDRGLIKPGYKADLVVFDMDELKCNATDSDPKQHPSGIDYVFVNGEPVINQGIHSGATPGRVLLHNPS